MSMPTGFSWAWVIGMLLLPVAGYMDLRLAIALILLIGVIANTGIYMSIKTLASYLKQLKDGPEKEEAYELMTEIIRRRIQHVGGPRCSFLIQNHRFPTCILSANIQPCLCSKVLTLKHIVRLVR